MRKRYAWVDGKLVAIESAAEKVVFVPIEWPVITTQLHDEIARVERLILAATR